MNAPFSPSLRIERAYGKAIREILRASIPAKESGQSFEDWVQVLAGLGNHPSVERLSLRAAERMVQWSEVQSARGWREASARSQHSRMLYQLRQRELSGPIGERYWRMIDENARLIRSIPNDVAAHLTRHLAEAQNAGLRPEAVSRMMRVEFPRLTRWKVNLIARTEVAKAASAITEVKARSIGINAFVWDTSRDQRVRKSHRNLQGVVVLWDDPPAPEALVGERSSLGHYLPGNCPNCRCGANPLLSLEDVTWPRKVYYHGRIRPMTAAAFARSFGNPERIAA